MLCPWGTAQRGPKEKPGIGATAEAAKSEEEPSKGKDPWSTVPKLLAEGRAMIQVAVEEAEILAASEPYGFTKEYLGELLARLDELERQDRDQEAAKGSRKAARSDLDALERRVRRWYFPWKDRIQGAVRGRPELLVKLGLSA